VRRNEFMSHPKHSAHLPGRGPSRGRLGEKHRYKHEHTYAQNQCHPASNHWRRAGTPRAAPRSDLRRSGDCVANQLLGCSATRAVVAPNIRRALSFQVAYGADARCHAVSRDFAFAGSKNDHGLSSRSLVTSLLQALQHSRVTRVQVLQQVSQLSPKSLVWGVPLRWLAPLIGRLTVAPGSHLEHLECEM
jgi:hypothetical protein